MAESIGTVAPRSGGRRKKVSRRRWTSVGGGVLAVGLAVGGVSLAAGRAGASPYRLAEAEVAAVAQSVDAVGTVSSASRADVAFPVAGTVETVTVAVGDSVTAGKTLATLDPSDLQDALDEASAVVADAQQKLQDELDSQTTTVTTVTASVSVAGTTSAAATAAGANSQDSASGAAQAAPSSTPAKIDPAVDAAVEAVRAAQQDLLAAHGAAQTLLETSRASLVAAQSSCSAVVEPEPTDEPGDEPTAEPTDEPGDEPTAEPTPTPSADPTPEPTDEPSAEPTDEPTDAPSTDPTDAPTTAEAVAACQAAVTQLLADQEAVTDAQTTVAALAVALDTTVAEAEKAVLKAASDATASQGDTPDSSGGTTSVTPSSAPSSDAGGISAGGVTTTSASGGTPTAKVASAADLLADQAAIDVARAEVALAQSRLDRIVLTTPIAGTVAAVSITTGDSVQASSSSAVITVLGQAGHLVTTTLGLSVIDTVAVGQTATVTVPSTPDVLTATVSSIGVLDVSTTSTPSYTVVLALEPTDATLYDDSSAQVSIDVAAQDATLTVPTSAVHKADSGATVQQLVDGVLVDVEVGVGTVGTERTEITSGLDEGAQVVLADLSASLVSPDTGSTQSGLSGLGESTTTTRTTGGFGGGEGGPRPQGG